MVDEETEVIAAELSPTQRVRFLEVLSSRSSIIRDGFAHWDGLRRGVEAPLRSDFDPFDVTPLMPHIVMLEVQQEPRDFRYRVIGTFVSDHLAQNWTGSWMSEIEHQKPSSRIWASCDHVVETRFPMLSRIPYVGPHADFLYGEDVILPLINDAGEVVNLLVFVSYIRKD
jgi:hypothetical protein